MTVDPRAQQLHRWLEQQWQQTLPPPEPIFADASFRRYFRYQRDGRSEIAMDAPPHLEDCRPFVAVTNACAAQGLPVPTILAQDLEQGFLVLNDLGDTHFYKMLSRADVGCWYRKALALQPHFCRLTTTELGPLPAYDAAMLDFELELLPQWFAGEHLQIELPAEAWQQAKQALLANAAAQPQVGVHRDFHSRNLMVVGGNLALIDYQGAVLGPITYDLVSLLRDCYWRMDQKLLTELVAEQHQTLIKAGLVDAEVSLAQFTRWFDLTGLQRHLKVLGIFARLHHRDGKSGYLADLPRVLQYAVEVALRYPETQALGQWLAEQQQRLESQQ
ncbi:aminoglycoside phosphotransferase family protein [Ferrimonas senticii]|uniref:aminoglycoside phosphotransferase family protein n=1 Tax=Ferrimonas senticii TaxID=394566 RepID=UPI00042466C4|nr:phosphotransferase [Ferrimonas senticii]